METPMEPGLKLASKSIPESVLKSDENPHPKSRWISRKCDIIFET
jgi:hypothetical protein